MSLHGAGGDRKGGIWGQHRGCRSACPTWWTWHVTGVMLSLKEGEKYQPPQSAGPKHDLWLLELMGDSHLLLPQEIARIFFGNYQCPVLPPGILSAAPQQPGWRNARGLQADVCCRADPWAGCRAGLAAGLGAGRAHQAVVILCAASSHLQMPVGSGGDAGGSSWKEMCEWILLLQNDRAEVQVVCDGLGKGDDEQVKGCVIVLYLLLQPRVWLC